MKIKGNTIPLKLSLCIPDGCSPNDFLVSGIEYNTTDVMCQTKSTGKNLDGSDIAVM